MSEERISRWRGPKDPRRVAATKLGIERRRARGLKIGRSKIVTPTLGRVIRTRLEWGWSVLDIVKATGLGRTTIYDYIRFMKKQAEKQGYVDELPEPSGPYGSDQGDEDYEDPEADEDDA